MNWDLYRSFHARGLTQVKLAALTGIHRSVLAQILTNTPGRGKETRVKLFPHLTEEEIRLLGWQREYHAWTATSPQPSPHMGGEGENTKSSTQNIVPP